MAHKVVACLLGDGFEDSEFRVPYDRLREAGYRVDVIGTEAGEQVAGKKGDERVTVERGIDEVRAAEYDALLIPGGHSPDHLRADDRFVSFVRAFDGTQRPIAAVCHGPQLLMSAGLVRGRRLTAWKTIQQDLLEMGADVADEQVVEDRNWITSRQPSDLDAFSAAFVRALEHAQTHAAPDGGEGGEPDYQRLKREAAAEDAQDRHRDRGGTPFHGSL